MRDEWKVVTYVGDRYNAHAVAPVASLQPSLVVSLLAPPHLFSLSIVPMHLSLVKEISLKEIKTPGSLGSYLRTLVWREATIPPLILLRDEGGREMRYTRVWETNGESSVFVISLRL